MALLSSDERAHGGHAALRVLWFAKAGDVLVLPRLPDPEYVSYVTGVTRVDPDSLTLLVPPPDIDGEDLLTPERMADTGFRKQLRAAVREHRVDDILAICTDVTVVDLVDAVGLAAALPGRRFLGARGTSLLNSKAVFRALAAGAGIAVAPGHVVAEPDEAVRAVSGQFADGHSVMLKKEFQCGGLGNEIVSATAGLRPMGSSSVVVLPDDAALADYVSRRWDWLTVGGRDRLVVERFLPGCDTVYAEYFLGDDAPELSGTGQILMEPVAVAEVIPAAPLSTVAHAELVAESGRLCRTVHTMGYRGYFSTDAVLTRAGHIVFTETNARVSGSTHLHRIVRDRLLTAAQRPDRVLMERVGWVVPSFTAARDVLTRNGLDFDPATGTGVLITSSYLPDRTVTYCVVASDLAAATAIARRLGSSPDGTEVDRPAVAVPGGTR
ncbi:MAG TPA: peptide ligase PGM1-related protein [Pseudonocardiaceae bacterium]